GPGKSAKRNGEINGPLSRGLNDRAVRCTWDFDIDAIAARPGCGYNLFVGLAQAHPQRLRGGIGRYARTSFRTTVNAVTANGGAKPTDGGIAGQRTGDQLEGVRNNVIGGRG